MATLSNAGTATLDAMVATLVAADGTGASPHAASLARADATLRDLADAIHCLCVLHGTAPSLLDLSIGANGADAITDWLADTARAFSTERAALVALTAAVGPLPSTPGQAESEAAVLAQRHALAMLARSDRAGCAIGTALAFALDWATIRRLLDVAADRVGLALPASAMPGSAALGAVVAQLAAPPSAERAVVFGAQQLLAQHRGLWQLLDARASARRSS